MTRLRNSDSLFWRIRPVAPSGVDSVRPGRKGISSNVRKPFRVLLHPASHQYISATGHEPRSRSFDRWIGWPLSRRRLPQRGPQTQTRGRPAGEIDVQTNQSVGDRECFAACCPAVLAKGRFHLLVSSSLVLNILPGCSSISVIHAGLAHFAIPLSAPHQHFFVTKITSGEFSGNCAFFLDPLARFSGPV